MNAVAWFYSQRWPPAITLPARCRICEREIRGVRSGDVCQDCALGDDRETTRESIEEDA